LTKWAANADLLVMLRLIDAEIGVPFKRGTVFEAGGLGSGFAQAHADLEYTQQDGTQSRLSATRRLPPSGCRTDQCGASRADRPEPEGRYISTIPDALTKGAANADLLVMLRRIWTQRPIHATSGLFVGTTSPSPTTGSPRRPPF